MTMVIIVMPVVAVVVATMLLLMLRLMMMIISSSRMRAMGAAVPVEAPSLPPRVHGRSQAAPADLSSVRGCKALQASRDDVPAFSGVQTALFAAHRFRF